MTDSSAGIGDLLSFLSRLDRRSLKFRLWRSRPEAILVFVDVPGERWEIEFFADGHLEVERFKSDGSIFGVEAADELFSLFGENP